MNLTFQKEKFVGIIIFKNVTRDSKNFIISIKIEIICLPNRERKISYVQYLGYVNIKGLGGVSQVKIVGNVKKQLMNKLININGVIHLVPVVLFPINLCVLNVI